jgi:hypothetical protein
MRYLIVLFVLFYSCSDDERYQTLAGKWECESWLSQAGAPDKCNSNVLFTFSADKQYSSVLGSSRDTGTYRLQSDMLFVTPEGKNEFGVKITELNEQSLEFLMSLAGTEEALKLRRRDK